LQAKRGRFEFIARHLFNFNYNPKNAIANASTQKKRKTLPHTQAALVCEKTQMAIFFAPPTEYFPRPNFLFLSATRPDPNLCKPKADMSEISKPDQTQNPDQIIVGSSDIILCFLNIFFVIVGLLVVRPHCVIRWFSFRFVSDFAGHKSEIVF